jgi:hypothetical protein
MIGRPKIMPRSNGIAMMSWCGILVCLVLPLGLAQPANTAENPGESPFECEQDHIGLRLLQGGEDLGPGRASGHDGIRGGLEQGNEAFQHDRMIIGDENGGHGL